MSKKLLSKLEDPRHSPPRILNADLGNEGLKLLALMPDGTVQVGYMPYGYYPLSEGDWLREQRNHAQGRMRPQADTQIIKVNNKAYVIGRAARDRRGHDAPIGTAKYEADILPVVLTGLLLQSIPRGYDNVVLTIGHPPTDFEHAERIIQLVGGTHRVETVDGRKVKFRIPVSITFDEAAGGMVQAGSQRKTRNPATGQWARINLKHGERVIGIDAGGRRGSIGIFEAVSAGNRVQIVPHWDTFKPIEGGWVSIKAKLQSELKSLFPDKLRLVKALPDHALERAILTRQLMLNGEDLDVSQAVENSLTYVDQVRKLFRDDFEGGSTASYVLLTGGTVKHLYPDLVRDALSSFRPDRVLPVTDLNEVYLANVHGSLHITMAKLHELGLVPSEYRYMVSA